MDPVKYNKFLAKQIDKIMHEVTYIRDTCQDSYIQSMISEVIINHMKDRKEFLEGESECT
jgi:hypothetical protein